MQGNPAAAEKAVVDLLLTWGVSADPAMRDLLEALSAFRSRDGIALIRGALDAPGIVLEPELRQEASALLDASRDESLDPDFESRLDQTLSRLDRAVRSSATAQRKAVQAELNAWARLLEAEELDQIWDRLWSGEAAEDLADRLCAMRSLEQARAALGKARWRIDAEVRRLLEADRAATLDANLAERARRALDSGDPRQLAVMRVELQVLRRREHRVRGAEERSAARQRLADLCERARRTIDDPDGELGETSRELLRSAVDRCGTLVAESAEPSSPEEEELLLRSLSSWESALSAMLETAPPAPAGHARQKRRALADELARQITAVVAQPTGDDVASDDSEEARRIAKDLEGAADAGGGPFHSAVARAVELRGSLRTAHAQRAEGAAADLREAANALSAELEESASALPIDRVVQSRLLLEQAEGTVAAGQLPEMQSLSGAIREHAEAVRSLADRSRRHRSSRGAAERKRLRGEANRLLRMARAGTSRRVKSLAQKLRKADAGALEKLSHDLEALASRVGNAVRLEAARVLHGAERPSRRSGDSASRGELDEKIGALRTALAEDDLSSMAEISRELRSGLGGSTRWGGTGVRIVLAAAGLLIVLGLFFAWQHFSTGARTYQLTLSDTHPLPDRATLTLVRNGEVFDRRPYEAGRATTVDLPPGRYEVYVNDRYTGRVVRVPEDAREVNGIPVPPPTIGGE